MAKTSDIKIFDAPLGMGRYCIIDESTEAEALCKQTGLDLRVLGRLDYAGQVVTFVKDGEWLVVVRIAPHGETMEDVFSTVLHECVHVVQHLIANIDDKEPSREFQARLSEEVMMNLVKEYFRHSEAFTQFLVTSNKTSED